MVRPICWLIGDSVVSEGVAQYAASIDAVFVNSSKENATMFETGLTQIMDARMRRFSFPFKTELEPVTLIVFLRGADFDGEFILTRAQSRIRAKLTTIALMQYEDAKLREDYSHYTSHISVLTGFEAADVLTAISEALSND